MRTAAIIKPSGIAAFLAATLSRRTAIAAICDSNGEQVSVTGHNEGMRRGASFLLGCYGTGVFPGSGDGGYASGCLDCTDNYANGNAGAPAGLLAITCNGGVGGPESADYFASGWAAATTLGALMISGMHPMDQNRSVRFHSKIWRPQSGGMTQFRPCIFGGGVGTVFYPVSPALVTIGAVPASGISDFTFDIPEGTLVNYASPSDPSGDGRGWNYREQSWTGVGGTDLTGAVAILYRQAEDLGCYRGIQWSKLVTLGGLSARSPAIALCNTYSDAALAEWFKAHADVQVNSARTALPPMMLIQIIEGGNDAGDTASSIFYPRGVGFGNATTTGNAAENTKAGFKLTLQAIMNRLRDVWVNTCGYDEQNLYFLLGPYHPQPPAQTQYTFTRTTAVDAYTELCAENDNCTAVDGYKMETHELFSYAFSYEPQSGVRSTPTTDTFFRDAAGDWAHLNQPAYHHWGLLTWRNIVDACLDFSAPGGPTKCRMIDAVSGQTIIDVR